MFMKKVRSYDLWMKPCVKVSFLRVYTKDNGTKNL